MHLYKDVMILLKFVMHELFLKGNNLGNLIFDSLKYSVYYYYIIIGVLKK